MLFTKTSCVVSHYPDLAKVKRLFFRLNLNESMIVWLNPDRTKPKDGTVRCFMGLAEYFGIEDCTLFLAIVNIFGFCILGGSLIVGFLVVKNR